ncbi:hypothetical protein [Ottowia thiooxydans]|uniref:hypothetical protein n=1 Tax=Ottowia thiooxydans TaxID=219182 RepID=UPI0004203F04|nr:hypothetical protein [Ottowia thiooxydans]
MSNTTNEESFLRQAVELARAAPFSMQSMRIRHAPAIHEDQPGLYAHWAKKHNAQTEKT